MIRTTHTLSFLLVAASLTSCGALGIGGAKRVGLDEAASILVEAEQSLADGDHSSALDSLKSLLHVENLTTSQRTRVLQLFAIAAERQISSLSASPEGAKELAGFVDDELPREVAVSAGIASAQSYLAKSEPEEAWKILRRLDERYPLHHERAMAGRLLVEAGLNLSRDGRSWWIFWSARAEGLACLEYVVLNHPSQSRCDEAYLRLGEMYAEDIQRKLAIERYSDLVLYHPDSPLRAAAQARIPMLRLDLLNSPEYDRNGLILAQAELEDWVIRFPTHPLREPVLASRLDCLRRLSASDLDISRFYERIDNREGKLFHAKRALEEAQSSGDAGLAAAAHALLETPEPEDA